MLGHTRLTDFVDIYCDHRDSCGNRKCSCKPIQKFSQENVAFSEKRKCKDYRGSDDLGTVREAIIKEVGVWK